MKFNIKEKNDFLRSLNIEVKWEDLENEYKKEYIKVKTQYSMPGFRKGKVPDHVIKKNLGKSIESNFIDHAVNIYYKKALKELNITPINQAKIVDLKFEEKSDLKFDIEFEVIPNIKLPNYQKKSKINTEKYIANDKDIEESLLNIQTQYAKAKSVTGKIQSGQFIYADFNKLDDNKQIIEDSVLKNHYVKIGEGLFVGELEKKFLNKTIGDQIDIVIKQDSKDINYRVKINKIEEQILPKLDDDFAKLVSKETKTIKQLKSMLLNNIQSNLDNENKKMYNQKIIDFFISKTKFIPPQSMVDNYQKQLIEQYKQEAKSKNQPIDEKKLTDDTVIASNNMIKWYLIKQEIQTKESIIVIDKDIEGYIQKIIDSNPTQKKEIVKHYNQDTNKNQLYQNLIDEKLFKILGTYFENIMKEKSTDKLRAKKDKA